MIGKKIDPNIHVDYKGKRVFFCCLQCKSSFLENPEKYLPRLPQFAETLEGSGRAAHEHGGEGLSLASFVEPTGILTLSLVALTVCLALLRRAKRFRGRLIMKMHKTAGICTLCAGALHATLVMLAY